jgi:hypothetical protein
MPSRLAPRIPRAGEVACGNLVHATGRRLAGARGNYTHFGHRPESVKLTSLTV